jgi:aspartokinase-like uncharacterized kinase
VIRFDTLIRVIKVGGSLFDWPLLPIALASWLDEQAPAVSVLIAGGGSLVDAIRRSTQAWSLDDESAHWLCINAMGINARILGEALREKKWIATYADLRLAVGANSSWRIVFDANQFLREHESHLPGCLLPRDWSVTSDSIAARVAEVLVADELVLMKSTDPPATFTTTKALAETGFVDRYFPAFDRCHFRRQFINLRRATKCPAPSKGNLLGHIRDR